MSDTPILNAFSIDVEDYFHVSAFSSVIDPKDWDSWESRVVANTEKILEILDHANTRGTFFVLGWVAERNPALIKKIHLLKVGCRSSMEKQSGQSKSLKG